MSDTQRTAQELADERLADCIPETARILEVGSVRKVTMTRAELHQFASNVIAALASQAEPVAWVERSDLADLARCNGRNLWAESPWLYAPHDQRGVKAPGNLVAVYAAPAQAEPSEDEVREARRLRSAARTLEYIGYTYNGGVIWKAPASAQAEPITVASLAAASGRKATAIFPAINAAGPEVTLNEPLSLSRIADALAAQAEQSEDGRRLDHLQEMADNGVVSMCFEFDGGYHVTLEGVSEEPIAARHVNTIRDGIDWFIEQRDAAAKEQQS